MGIRVAGRSDSGTSFALTAATGIGSPGIVPNKRVAPNADLQTKTGMSEGWNRNLGMDSAYMGIRVAGRSDSGTRFSLTAATGDGSASEQSNYGIDSNTGLIQIQDRFQYGMRSNTGSVPIRYTFQCGIRSNAGYAPIRNKPNRL